MTAREFPRLTRGVAAVSAGLFVLALVMAPAALAADQPKYGGTLVFAVPKDPPLL